MAQGASGPAGRGLWRAWLRQAKRREGGRGLHPASSMCAAALSGGKAVKMYVIDGERFETLEGFYNEIGRVLIPGADWGRNLDAFNDILRGGFGTPEGGFTL